MIRKIALALVVLFVLTWIVLAHFAKSKIVSFVNNSQTDNIKISYSDASIAGFPFGFQVRFASPKITIIDQAISREIASDYLNCSFSYKLGNAKLDFGKVLYYSSARKFLFPIPKSIVIVFPVFDKLALRRTGIPF